MIAKEPWRTAAVRTVVNTNQIPPWNYFHGVAVSLSSLRPTKPLRGITSTVSWFHYLHCNRPTPWIHFHGTTDSLFSLLPPNTPPWNHFHSTMDPLPRIFLPETEFVRLAAAVTFPPSPYSPVNCRVLTGRPTCFSTTPNSTPFPPTTPRAASLHHC